MTISDKRRAAQKEAAKKRPQTWKPGQSGNPKGGPKRGVSWAELIKEIGDMTPAAAADYCRAVAGKLGAIGGDVTLKEAVVLRVYAALLFEPSPGLLNTFMERVEGAVPKQLDVNGVIAPQIIIQYADEIVREPSGSSSEPEDNQSGA